MDAVVKEIRDKWQTHRKIQHHIQRLHKEFFPGQSVPRSLDDRIRATVVGLIKRNS